MTEPEIIKGLEGIAAYLGVSRETVKNWIRQERPEAKAFRKLVGARFAFRADLDAIRLGQTHKIKA